LLWVGGIVFVLAFIGNLASKDDDIKAEEPKEEMVKENSKEERQKEKEEVPEEPIEYKIDIDKTIELNGATIVLQSLRVKDNIADLYAYWNHTSQYDKAHLDLLVTTSIVQNGEY